MLQRLKKKTTEVKGILKYMRNLLSGGFRVSLGGGGGIKEYPCSVTVIYRRF